MQTDFLGSSSMRRNTPSDCCHTDSNASTNAGHNQLPSQQQQQQQQQAQNSSSHNQATFGGEDDSSCDSQTRWGKNLAQTLRIIYHSKDHSDNHTNTNRPMYTDMLPDKFNSNDMLHSSPAPYHKSESWNPHNIYFFEFFP